MNISRKGRRGMAQWRAAMLLAVMALPAGCSDSAPGKERFTDEVMNGYTPVKDQGCSHTCWAYAMLAAIETEHIMRGDSVHLSVAYAVRSALADDARRLYMTGGGWDVSSRGTMPRLTGTVMTHGIVPYDAYRREAATSSAVLARRVERLGEVAVNTRAGLARYGRQTGRLLDETLGPKPRTVFMLGAEYTPQEFARSVCAPGEWTALTSFTHHPFYSRFALEIPDNRGCDMFLNVPIDTLMAVVERAVRTGHGVCWEGDISERGFSFSQGVARLPRRAAVTQGDRQRAFERFETTDDHCMAIVGMARNDRGEKYFVMKNSWGTANPYGGMMYVSEQYVRLKTVAVCVPIWPEE